MFENNTSQGASAGVIVHGIVVRTQEYNIVNYRVDCIKGVPVKI